MQTVISFTNTPSYKLKDLSETVAKSKICLIFEVVLRSLRLNYKSWTKVIHGMGRSFEMTSESSTHHFVTGVVG